MKILTNVLISGTGLGAQALGVTSGWSQFNNSIYDININKQGHIDVADDRLLTNLSSSKSIRDNSAIMNSDWTWYWSSRPQAQPPK